MKKIIAILLAACLLLALTACGGNTNSDPAPTRQPAATQQPAGNGSDTQPADTGSDADTDTDVTDVPDTGSIAPEGAVTDETKLGEAVSYYVDGDHLYLKIKTSYEFDAQDASIDIVNPGIYLTRDSEFITQCIYDGYHCFAEDFDKEWFDGVYVFALDNNMVTDLASDESEWAPGTWTMMLYEEDTGLVIGEWFIVLEGGGKYHFEYKDAWLRGAGEDRKVKEFDSLEDEVASWFTFKPDESYDEWAVFNFDGYYLEEVDPYGYDHYYLMVCPEGDYATYEDADAADLTYCGFGGFDYAKCPYRFAFEQYGLEPGKYTMVLARDGRNDLGVGGNVEIQLSAEKVSATEWKLDFKDAKCPMLNEKYGIAPAEAASAPDAAPADAQTELPAEGSILALCGLTAADIRTPDGAFAGEPTETSDGYMACIDCGDTSFEAFESWLNALADSCRSAAKDGIIYEPNFFEPDSVEPLEAFELEADALNIVQFAYKTNGHEIYVTAANTGSEEYQDAFSCYLSVY